MAGQVLTNSRLYYKGHDLSGMTNNITLNYSADLLDRTCFDSVSRKRLAGLKSMELSMAGFWDSSHKNVASSEVGPDRLMYNAIGGTSDVMSVVPRGTGFGFGAHFTKGIAGEYSPAGSIGELMGYTFNAYGEGEPVVHGKLMHAGPLTTESLKSTGIDFANGATGTKIYAGVHVLGVATGVKMSIEFGMDTDVAFPGASTMLTIGISTDDIGQSKWGSSALAGTSTLSQYYRLTLANNGTSGTTSAGARTNAIIVFGHKKP